MDDRMNRQLTALLLEEDSSDDLADELVNFGFISSVSNLQDQNTL